MAPTADGHIQVSLSGEDFNFGVYELTEGRDNGAGVEVTVSLISEASVVDVPEPGTLALFEVAMLGLRAVVSRRRFDR